MAGSKNSKRSRPSKPTGARGGAGQVLTCFAVCCAVMAVAVYYFQATGATLYSGDAEAHLNIARRVVDSRTPGWAQLGTTWLPLPHLLMLPFVRYDSLWMTGLAGAIPSAMLMSLAAAFLFATVRRVLGGALPATVATAVFLLNPNILYLGSIPMTEAASFASMLALLYCSTVFGETQSWISVVGAGVAAFAGSWSRYETWFLLPFAGLYILVRGRERRWAAAAIFAAIAGAGPVSWFVHNWWYFGDPLYFYRGPWSAKAIQGAHPYPGRGDWRLAALYFYEAGKLVAGLPALMIGVFGAALVCANRRVVWPVAMVVMPPAFYIWSIHSSGTPVFVPHLEPHGWYNIRYATAFVPLAAVGAAAISRFGRIAAVAVLLAVFAPFAWYWRKPPIVLEEAAHNSEGRREWTAKVVAVLRAQSGPGDTFFTSFNDLTAIYRTLGVPLRNTLTGDNNPQFFMAQNRPEMFLWEEFAVAMGGDTVQGIVENTYLKGPKYDLLQRITVKGQPSIEIFRRQRFPNPTPLPDTQ